MSWQEELRKLDEDLAAGRISADDYRVRRDQVLSSAVTQDEPVAAPQQGDSDGAKQQSEKPAADSTQVISPISQQPSNQQQAPPSYAAESNQAGSGAGSEHQQPAGRAQQPQSPVPQSPVPQSPNQQARPASPAGGFQQPPQQPWNAPEQDMTPPWGGSDFPPPNAGAGSEWAAQGPEGFDDRSKRKGGKIAAIAVAVVIVLSGLGLGGFFLFAKDGQTNAHATGDKRAQDAPPASSTTRTKPPTPEERMLAALPKPPGKANTASGLHTASELEQLGIVAAAEASLLEENAVSNIAWRGSQKKPNEFGPTDDKFSLMAIPVADNDAAKELVEELAKYHLDNKLVEIPEPLPGVPEEVAFLKTPEGSPATYIGIWASGDKVIRVQTIQDPRQNEAALSGSYQRAIKPALKRYPLTN